MYTEPVLIISCLQLDDIFLMRNEGGGQQMAGRNKKSSVLEIRKTEREACFRYSPKVQVNEYEYGIYAFSESLKYNLKQSAE